MTVVTTFRHMTLATVLHQRFYGDFFRSFVTLHDPRGPDDGGTSMKYAVCRNEVERLRGLLQAAGLRAGDRVVVFMGNSLEHVVSLLALLSMEAVAVPVDVDLPDKELTEILDHSRCAAIVTDEQYEARAGAAAQALSGPVMVVRDGRVVSGQPAVSRQNAATGALADKGTPPGRRPALIFYRRTAEGRLRGVVFSHEACLAAGAGTRNELGMGPRDSTYCVLPLAHPELVFRQLLPALLTGSHLLVAPGFHVDHYWRVVGRSRVSLSYLTTEQRQALLARDETAEERETALRMLVTRPPVTHADVTAVRTRFRVDLSLGWGTLESGLCGARTPLHLDFGYDGPSVGVVSPGWRMRVRDGAGHDVPAGQPGELQITGPALMTEYFDDPEATDAAFDDGWLRTAEYGWMDDLGYVYLGPAADGEPEAAG